ncbi:hypothetical protein [Bacillus cereus group sp. TH152-1LC]|uniref:hypothetical protein n=1 Tax=Bacillus cereus group sp. TH152-1LC TaxID=3018060 RepID=UPI0022E8A445|nr:hypothetical protein [Bacillus cereus group sp. TH152-1LC]MDA1675358.1 hypothetical protein [Bacillus cereus group sp. TH152-1LC]
MEDMLKQILSKLDGLEKGQVRIEEKVDNLTMQLEEKLNDNKRVFEAIKEELRDTKFKIKSLSRKYGEHEIEIESLIRKIKS